MYVYLLMEEYDNDFDPPCRNVVSVYKHEEAAERRATELGKVMFSRHTYYVLEVPLLDPADHGA